MFKKVNDSHISDDDIVNVKIIKEDVIFTKSYAKNRECRIKNISKNEYEDVNTGEVKKRKKNTTGKVNLISARQSSKKLRDLINNNVDTSGRCLLLTLTYKNEEESFNSMKDGGKLLKYKLKGKKVKERFHYNNYEYIMINEAQGSGRFHLHIFLITDNPNVYIKSQELEKIWQKGFVKIEKIKEDVTNLGYYYDYIFNSMSLYETKRSNIYSKLFMLPDKPELKEWQGPRGGKHTKRVIKGARMLLMNEYTRHYSFSSGLKAPEEHKDVNYLVAREKFLNNQNKKPDEQYSYLIGDSKYESFNKITKQIYKNSKKTGEICDD